MLQPMHPANQNLCKHSPQFINYILTVCALVCFDCVQAFIRAHLHVFVLTQKRVYSRKEHRGPRRRSSLQQVWQRKTFGVLFVTENEPRSWEYLSYQTGCSSVTRLWERVSRDNRCPGLLFHISCIMSFPVSSDDGCHPLQRFKTNTRYSDVFSSLLSACQSEEPRADVLHSAPHARNPPPPPRPPKKSTYCKL